MKVVYKKNIKIWNTFTLWIRNIFVEIYCISYIRVCAIASIIFPLQKVHFICKFYFIFIYLFYSLRVAIKYISNILKNFWLCEWQTKIVLIYIKKFMKKIMQIYYMQKTWSGLLDNLTVDSLMKDYLNSPSHRTLYAFTLRVSLFI